MNHIPVRRLLIIFLGVILGIFGVLFGKFVYNIEGFETINKGILGLTVFVLVLLQFLSPNSQYRTKASLDFSFPSILKFIVVFLVLSIVLYRSFQYVYFAILFILNLI